MIKGLAADLIVTVYLLATLYLRFQAEKGLVDYPFLSIAVGVVMLLILWAFIKGNIIQPDYFGLLKKRKK